MVKGETTNRLTDYKAWEAGKTDDESCGSAKRGVCGTSIGRSSLRSPSRRPSAMIDPEIIKKINTKSPRHCRMLFLNGRIPDFLG